MGSLQTTNSVRHRVDRAVPTWTDLETAKNRLEEDEF